MVASAPEPDLWLFFDGDCGLCHGAVKWTLQRDKAARFRFAPLHGETFCRLVEEERRSTLPDSLVVLDPQGVLSTRGEAVRVILASLGDRYRLLAGVMRCIPLPLLNLGYRVVARVRRYLFAKPQTVCPVVPEHWRGRFAL